MYRLVDLIPDPGRDVIYELLHHIPLSRCVDIGAAAGLVSRRILQAGNANTRLIAFEPFPGNHRYFRRATAEWPNVLLKSSAVSDRVGWDLMTVDSVVAGTESGWESFAGYSSVGRLAPRIGYWPLTLYRKCRDWVPRRRTAASPPPGIELKVETTTIDAEFRTEHLDFVKIDVQGAEERVLRGAKHALAEQRIGILYVEWSGEQPVVDLLERAGYHVYDSTYIAIPKDQSPEAFEQLGFVKMHDVPLSTGRLAFEMTLPSALRTPSELIAEVRRQGLGYVQTDLIAVSSKSMSAFREAVRQHISIVGS